MEREGTARRKPDPVGVTALVVSVFALALGFWRPTTRTGTEEVSRDERVTVTESVVLTDTAGLPRLSASGTRDGVNVVADSGESRRSILLDVLDMNTEPRVRVTLKLGAGPRAEVTACTIPVRELITALRDLGATVETIPARASGRNSATRKSGDATERH